MEEPANQKILKITNTFFLKDSSNFLHIPTRPVSSYQPVTARQKDFKVKKGGKIKYFRRIMSWDKTDTRRILKKKMNYQKMSTKYFFQDLRCFVENTTLKAFSYQVGTHQGHWKKSPACSPAVFLVKLST